ncbi:MAG: ATP-dependent DNA helicase [Bdellovibrionales bacterium RBG_16_40_8]|nr:MAG: ATP-dependent DNA helicase [Bdellovibrionales bacterium RBG_16_40_8]
MEIESLLSELNAPQREAVKTLTGPLLILAGAGSGKTRVLTFRVANLVLQGEATPGQILAVTFTNKAAREMARRTESLLMGMGIPLHEPLWISTFHSSCARLLREDIHRLGYQPFFVIYDDSDQLSVLKHVCKNLNLNDKVYPAKSFRHHISQAKMLGLSPDKVATQSFFRMDETTLEVYRLYEEELRRANALDFDDLLLKTYELLKNFPDVLKAYREKFRFILVDEYQDTNHVQYLLIKLLAEEHRNICVVGDEDQSIYSWRGADIKNILDFEKDFPEACVIKLEENYRSSKNIVEAASHVISNNTQRKNKTLFTQSEAGSKISLQAENNEYDEARFVVRKIGELRRNSHSLSDIAIFYRTNAQSRVLEEQLRSNSIPYRLIGSVKFYERKEIKDIICYMRLILNTNDDVAFYRVVNTPTRGIGKSTIEEVLKMTSTHKISAFEAAGQVAMQRLVHSGACNKLQNFRYLIETMKDELKSASTSEIYLRILDKTQYAQRLKEEKTPESEARLENLEEFQNAILQFEEEREEEATLQAFLEEMALISDTDNLNENTAAVTLMTLHLSKGLEYNNVFIVGLEEGLFPSGRSLAGDDPNLLEEERRICYVGMTRARHNLFMSYAKSRCVYGQEEYRPPSRFVDEIPEKYINANASIKRPAFLDRYAEKYSKKESVFPNYEDDNFTDESFSQKPSDNYKRGERVRHPIFGTGSIFQVEGSGEQQKVSVLFADKSLKKFMAKAARLERV